MSTHSMNRRLLWKETRQVLPLALSLVGIAFVIVVWFRLMVMHQLTDFLIFAQFMFAMPPILFAVGAGSALVSVEKESRSLNWLVSLPLPTTYLVRHQFMVGLAGLSALWLGCLVIYLLTSYFYPNHRDLYELGKIQFFVVLNSLYLLVCGFTTAWLARASILGLFSILVLAVLPYFAAYRVHYAFVELFTRGIAYHQDPSPWLTGAILLLFTGGIGRYGLYAADRQLTSHVYSAPSARKQKIDNLLQSVGGSLQDYFRGDSQLKSVPSTATGSLLWQFRNQNRVIVAGIYITFVLCMPIARHFINNNDDVFHPAISATCGMIAFSTLSWMALLTFHGDHMQDRIRFLAIHGVSPTRVWFTRHAIPVVFLLFYIFVLWWTSSDDLSSDQLRNPSYWIIACGILYAVSQWISQLIRPAALAALVAPLSGAFALSVGLWATEELGTSIFAIVSALVVLPLFATWWMMSSWMDGRRGWRYWLSHFGFASVAALLPLFSLITWFFFVPAGFSEAERTQLKEEAAAIFATEKMTLMTQPLAEAMHEHAPEPPSDAINPAEADLGRKRAMRYEALAKAIRNTQDRVMLRPTFREINNWIMDAAQLELILSYGEQDETARDVTLREYRDYLSTLSRLVTKLRHNESLSHQEECDLLEIWLLSQITKPESRQYLDDATYAEVVQNVSQTEQRWEARRRSLIVALVDSLDKPLPKHARRKLGGITIGEQPVGKQSLFDRLSSQRKFEQTMKCLLDYINYAKAGRGEFPREVLIEYLDVSPACYGAGPIGPFARIDDVSKYSQGTTFNGALAAQWGAGWEETASDMASNLSQAITKESAK